MTPQLSRLRRAHAPELKCSSSPAPAQQQHLADQGQWACMEEVYDALARRICDLALATPPGSKCMVALAGPPGAGKSTVADAVMQRANDPAWRKAQGLQGEHPPPGEDCFPLAVAVPMDGFHLYRWQLDCMPDPREAHARRGAPWTFDPLALHRHLKRILDQGQGVLPSFDHGVGDPVERDITVGKEVRVVLVEGNYLLLGEGHWALLRPLFAEAWFLDVGVDEAMQRVEDRHVGTGNSREKARFRVLNNDLPNALAILGTKGAADLVVPSLPLRGSP